MSVLDALKWRYAVKMFDTANKPGKEKIELLKEAVRLSASSLGLQPYKVYVVSDSKIREELRAVSWNQPQITDAECLFIFCHYTKIDDAIIDSYTENIEKTRKQEPGTAAAFNKSIKNTVNSMKDEDLAVWTSRQAYIALGTLLTAAADMRIDACPMEGFNKDEYNRILGLKEKGLSSVVVAAVGYRSESDKYSKLEKVRRPAEELFTEI